MDLKYEGEASYNKIVSYMFLRFDIKFRNSQKSIALFGKTKEIKRIRFYNNFIITVIDSLQVGNHNRLSRCNKKIVYQD